MTMSFGKYKGKELEEIAIENPNYVFWLCEHNIIKIPEHILELASENLILDIPKPDINMI